MIEVNKICIKGIYRLARRLSSAFELPRRRATKAHVCVAFPAFINTTNSAKGILYTASATKRMARAIECALARKCAAKQAPVGNCACLRPSRVSASIHKGPFIFNARTIS